jgi:hypothetical protein
MRLTALSLSSPPHAQRQGIVRDSKFRDVFGLNPSRDFSAYDPRVKHSETIPQSKADQAHLLKIVEEMIVEPFKNRNVTIYFDKGHRSRQSREDYGLWFDELEAKFKQESLRIFKGQRLIDENSELIPYHDQENPKYRDLKQVSVFSIFLKNYTEPQLKTLKELLTTTISRRV